VLKAAACDDIFTDQEISDARFSRSGLGQAMTALT
jgi:hypothetical protein